MYKDNLNKVIVNVITDDNQWVGLSFGFWHCNIKNPKGH